MQVKILKKNSVPAKAEEGSMEMCNPAGGECLTMKVNSDRPKVASFPNPKGMKGNLEYQAQGEPPKSNCGSRRI